MNPAHAHLIVNHVPVIGSAIALLLLVLAAIRRDPGLAFAGWLVALIAAVGSVVAFKTGERAEHLVEELTHVNLPALHEHEDRAKAAIWVAGITGVVALAGLVVGTRSAAGALRQVFVLLAAGFSLILVLSMAWTASQGSRILHSEIDMEWREGGPAP